jgi:hypothetical protein
VFDEYSRTKRLDLEMLKTLANGDASGAYLNRKSHGGSYIPPADVQVIILSNYSPYEIYAQWDKKTQRHIISEDILSTIVDRFVIVRLDGDDAEERRKFMEPSTWTEEEFQMELQCIRVACLKGDNDRVETAEFICAAIQLYIARTRYGKSIENFIKSSLWDGNDIRLTRLLYQDNLRRIKQPPLDRWRRETVFELPPSGEEITKGMIAMREQMDDQSVYCSVNVAIISIIMMSFFFKSVLPRI